MALAFSALAAEGRAVQAPELTGKLAHSNVCRATTGPLLLRVLRHAADEMV